MCQFVFRKLKLSGGRRTLKVTDFMPRERFGEWNSKQSSVVYTFPPQKGPKNIFEFHKCIFFCVCSFPSWQVTKQVILARLCFSKLFIELTPSCNCYRRAISQVTSLRIPFSFISSIRYYVTFECSDRFRLQRLMTTILVEMKSIIILC